MSAIRNTEGRERGSQWKSARSVWETVAMLSPLKRIPKKGDRVAVLGHTGMYDVSEIDSKHWTVNVNLIGFADLTLKDIPWGILVFLDEDEASQAAAGS